MTTKNFIRYRSDYKYQLAEGYEVNISIKPKSDIKTDFIALDTAGNLWAKKGYAWDGPSGPVKDTREMVFSLISCKLKTARGLGNSTVASSIGYVDHGQECV